MTNNLHNFIVINDYVFKVQRSSNRGEMTSEELISEYVSPVKDTIQVKIGIIEGIIETKQKELLESTYTMCLNLNYEIKGLKEQVEMLTEILEQL